MEYRTYLITTVLIVVSIVHITDADNLDRDNYCPSSCDSYGWHTDFWCIDPPYCCLVENELACCFNDTQKLDGRWNDNHNCNHLLWWEHYWKFILGTGIALGLITIICSVLLIIYQVNYDRKRRRRLAERQMANMPMDETVGRQGTSSGDNPVFTVEPVSPPPYTADKPPEYIP